MLAEISGLTRIEFPSASATSGTTRGTTGAEGANTSSKWKFTDLALFPSPALATLDATTSSSCST